MTKITAELTKPLLIDGAMSTALEQLGADTNNSLWTASVLANQPALVKKVHQEYFKAG
ncbi:homocysteine S-methyltransferase family protein, partial [Limosilactobacillus reuteri]